MDLAKSSKIILPGKNKLVIVKMNYCIGNWSIKIKS